MIRETNQEHGGNSYPSGHTTELFEWLLCVLVGSLLGHYVGVWFILVWFRFGFSILCCFVPFFLWDWVGMFWLHVTLRFWLGVGTFHECLTHVFLCVFDRFSTFLSKKVSSYSSLFWCVLFAVFWNGSSVWRFGESGLWCAIPEVIQRLLFANTKRCNVVFKVATTRVCHVYPA